MRGYWEILNPAYGMGRWTASYRGQLLAYHGGDLDGFHSQVSFMPKERIGVIVFVIGDHCASLYNTSATTSTSACWAWTRRPGASGGSRCG